MSISVDIGDRLYDYTDEEKAAGVISDYQCEFDLTDDAVIVLWNGAPSPERSELERRIFDAVDLNGSAKRAAESIPNDITLFIDAEALDVQTVG